jgi:iron complex transport system substrate-binding protein
MNAGGQCAVLRRLTAALLLLLSLATLPGAGAAPAPRIVSLAPHLTELLFTAGAADRIAGTVAYSDYPAAARDIPQVGDAFRVDVERILAIHPTLVLAWTTGTPTETITRLRRLGLAVETIEIQRLDDIGAALERLGELAGTTAVAKPAAQQFRTALAAARARYRGARPLRVFIEISDQPLYTVSTAHMISEMVGVCGGRNIFADLTQLAPIIGLEAVLARNPEVILSMDDAVTDPRQQWLRWSQVTAARAGTIYSVSSDSVTRASTRVLQGLDLICGRMDAARATLAGAAAQ